MQVDLADASEKIKKASTEGVSQVQGLIEENQSLRSDLEEARSQIGVKEQEHMQRLESIFQAHKLRTDSIQQQNFDTSAQLETRHKKDIDTLQDGHKAKIEQIRKESNTLIA